MIRVDCSSCRLRSQLLRCLPGHFTYPVLPTARPSQMEVAISNTARWFGHYRKLSGSLLNKTGAIGSCASQEACTWPARFSGASGTADKPTNMGLCAHGV